MSTPKRTIRVTLDVDIPAHFIASDHGVGLDVARRLNHSLAEDYPDREPAVQVRHVESEEVE